MAFSGLQRYILIEALVNTQRPLRREAIVRYYNALRRKPAPHDLANIISRSLDRLIIRHLLVGFGRKTATKWFIQSVRLTPRGRGVARKLLGVQQALPLKLKRKNDKVK